MKKLLFVFAISICLLFAGRVLAAEVINNFETTIKINPDATINVTEKITYDFGSSDRHGIYRDLPIKYQRDKNNYFINISNISVTDENGLPYPFIKKEIGNYLNIKIGDPDKTITGEHIYRIDYTVKWAINYFSDHDELYWNVTGNEWLVPIEKSAALVILPELIEPTKVQRACFSGSLGSQSSCNNILVYTENDLAKSLLFDEKYLPAQAGLTIVVGLSKGILYQPTKTEIAIKTIQENLKYLFLIILPIGIFIFLFYRWRRHGRDLPGRGTIIPQYEAPDNLTPAEVGTLIDETVDKQDVSADIINLAIRGYLKIKKIEKDDYLLTKLKEPNEFLAEFEKELIKDLFDAGQEKKLSALKYKFYKDLAEIKKQIYQRVTDNGYFVKNPQSVRLAYLIGGIAIIFLGFPLSAIFSPLAIISFFVSGLLFIIFSKFMPARTSKGTIAKEDILGLKMYLTVAEKDRLKFHNAPEKNPEIFEKLLPYAMVLKVAKDWAKQFEGIYNTAPGWYSDPAGGTFNAIIFASSLNSFSTRANSVLAATPQASAGAGGSGFGGGGFSGGGFGGGGGGSW